MSEFVVALFALLLTACQIRFAFLDCSFSTCFFHRASRKRAREETDEEKDERARKMAKLRHDKEEKAKQRKADKDKQKEAEKREKWEEAHYTSLALQEAKGEEAEFDDEAVTALFGDCLSCLWLAVA